MRSDSASQEPCLPRWEYVDARAKAYVDAGSLERLRGEWDQSAGAVDELCGKFDAANR
jgi:hypothetical protein